MRRSDFHAVSLSLGLISIPFCFNFHTQLLPIWRLDVHCLQDVHGPAPSLCPNTRLLLSLPPAETVRAMTHVINQGMAMYWGTSRWSSMEIMVGATSLGVPEPKSLLPGDGAGVC